MSDNKPKAVACSHCESYHARAGGLCANCELIPVEKREVQKKFKKQIRDNKKTADEAAKKAYLDALRDMNHENVAAVTGNDDTSSEKSESRALSLGK